MQIPVWLFLGTILLALTIQDMASLLLKTGARYSTASGLYTAARSGGLVGDIRAALPSFRVNSNTHQHPLATHKQPSHSFSTTSTSSQSSTTSPTTSMSSQFLETIKNRRTIYQLSNSSPISDAKIQEIIKDVFLHVPSSFNSQSTRAILLVKEEHVKLWNITKEILKAIVPAENWPTTEGKLSGFQAAYGTVRPSPFLKNPYPIQTNLSRRSSSSNPAPQSPACKRNSPPTPINSPSGPPNPTGCTNSHYGPPLKLRG